MPTKTTLADLKSVIAGGSGDPDRYRHPLFPRFTYSAGAREVAILGQANWLLEAIFSHLPYIDHEDDYFSVWELKPLPTDDNPHQFELVAHRGTGDEEPPLRSQTIPYSDFPLSEGVKFYCASEGDTCFLYLPSEH